jgi:hypothetical protein
MSDTRVRDYEREALAQILSGRRFKRPLPESTLVLISQAEMVRRIQAVRAQTPRCGECGRSA